MGDHMVNAGGGRVVGVGVVYCCSDSLAWVRPGSGMPHLFWFPGKTMCKLGLNQKFNTNLHHLCHRYHNVIEPNSGNNIYLNERSKMY